MPCLPRLSLYIHFPWCVKKCPYCDFNSHALPKHSSGSEFLGEDFPESEYVDALLDDIQADVELAQGRKIHSVFWGGGTPSLLNPDSVQRILSAVDAEWGLEADAEITLEANPGAIDRGRFTGFQQAGVNRLSIGVQSFNDDYLRVLGRVHSSQQASAAIDAAKQAGFNSMNIDLMFGLPEQSHSQALADLEQAMAFQPQHLSWYELTIEPNTAFYSQPPAMPGDDLQLHMMESGQQLLADSGYQRYEISAYSQAYQYSRHNLNYWQFGDYLGLGAGAHSKISTFNQGQLQIERYSKARQPDHYIKAVNKRVEQRTITGDERPLEFMMNALRLVAGIDADLYTQRTGQSWSVIEEKIQPLLDNQLLSYNQYNRQLSPTSKGLLLLNEVIGHFSS